MNNMNKAFVYTYGRVASTSIFESIKDYQESHHLHNIQPYFDRFLKNDSHQDLDSYIKESKIKIITGVREPISREISAFFTWMFKEGSKSKNHFGQYGGYGKYFISKDINKILSMETKELIDIFLKGLRFETIFDLEGCWFDNNIKKYFNIDIYENKLENDYLILSNNNVQILFYKYERLNFYGEKLISNFLSIKDDLFYIKNQNPYLDSKIRDKIIDFKVNLKFSKNDLDCIFDNKKIRHFYKDDEIKEIFSRYL